MPALVPTAAARSGALVLRNCPNFGKSFIIEERWADYSAPLQRFRNGRCSPGSFPVLR